MQQGRKSEINPTDLPRICLWVNLSINLFRVQSLCSNGFVKPVIPNIVESLKSNFSACFSQSNYPTLFVLTQKRKNNNNNTKNYSL